MPNFQIGELEVVRYNIRVLRDNLSRMRTTDKLDPAAEKAFTSLSNDPYKWWFPSAESKWKEANRGLGTFYENLLSGKSHFYPRADNLVELLQQYASLMGGANTRLINAPHDIDASLADEEQGKDSSESPTMVDINIPWYSIDNNFYYAQGIAYSASGSIKGPWVQEEKAFKGDNSGHGMFFTTFNGKRLFIIHHAEEKGPRKPQLYEIDDSGDKVILGERYHP